ncbi:MAG: DNA repair protein RecN [Actinomycetaceae bacterium]|nr:DNA repair protein RecN [Actinomycetaceae bacterium]
MIDELHIRDLGVIEEAHLELGPGLTVITGETGAGKTVLLTSIELLLGGRADTSKIRTGASEAVVDGVFTVDPLTLTALDIDSAGDGDVIISRRVGPSRSRAYLGRRPTPVTVLHELSPHLAVIHGQADQLNLRSATYQRELLDEFAGEQHMSLLADYRAAWKRAVHAKRARDEFEASLDEAESEIQQLVPVLETLDRLDLHEGEDDELRIEAERITNAEELRASLSAAYALLSGGTQGIGATDALGQASAHLQRSERLDPQLQQLTSRALAAGAELEALREDLSDYLDGLDADPARLDEIHARRRQITSLLRGRATTITELLNWAGTARERVTQWERKDDALAELTNELAEAQNEILTIGRSLSRSRHEAARSLSRHVDRELAGLSMKDTHLHVMLAPRERPGPHGLEDVSMELQPHTSATPVPLGHGASGGELSRIMLALEVVLAEHAPHAAHGQAYIFDEIDSGVGGRAAREVGRRLARLALSRQVLVVTHLPQVAAWATNHLLIVKNGGTTTVRELTNEERIVELARMLSGSESSTTARAHAAELLSQAKVAQSEM